MNRTSQTQFVNIQANISNKRDPKPQPPAPSNPQPGPTSSPSPRAPIQGTTTPKMMIQSRQGFNMEEAKINVESQPKILNQPGEALIMPKVKKPVTASLSFQMTRVKGMDMEEVKREYYSAKGECRQCGAVITRKFRGHTLDHIENLITARKATPKAQPVQQKVEAAPKTNKDQGTNLTKRTFEELPNNTAVEVLEKKHKGEVAALTKKIGELAKGLEDTQKQLKEVQSAQTTLNMNAESTQAQVTALESKVEAVIKTVGVHDVVLMEFVKRSQDERGQKVGILQRVLLKKDRVEEDLGEKQEKMTVE